MSQGWVHASLKTTREAGWCRCKASVEADAVTPASSVACTSSRCLNLVWWQSHAQHGPILRTSLTPSPSTALADDSPPPTFSFHLTTTLTYSPLQAATLTLIKHVPILDASLPLSTQLHFLNTFGPASSTSLTTTSSDAAGGSGVYEGLHRLVHYGVAPAFEAFVESKGRKEGVRRRGEEGKEGDSKMGIPMTKKKFAELELSLLHRKLLWAVATLGARGALLQI